MKFIQNFINFKGWGYITSILLLLVILLPIITYKIGKSKGEKEALRNSYLHVNRNDLRVEDNLTNTLKGVIEIHKLPPDSIAFKLNKYFYGENK
jgi:hypothetical protein